MVCKKTNGKSENVYTVQQRGWMEQTMFGRQETSGSKLIIELATSKPELTANSAIDGSHQLQNSTATVWASWDQPTGTSDGIGQLTGMSRLQTGESTLQSAGQVVCLLSLYIQARSYLF